MSYVNCVSIVNIYIHFIDMGVRERGKVMWCGSSFIYNNLQYFNDESNHKKKTIQWNEEKKKKN